MRRLAVALVVALFLVRLDFWWWNDPQLVLGLPIGLAYQVAFCLAAAVVLWFLVRVAWPRDLEQWAARTDDSEPPAPGEARS